MMKKFIAITAIILGMSMTTFAQGGLFHRGASAPEGETADYSLSKGGFRGDETPIPMLPSHNGSSESQPATPVGSGIAVLIGLGAAYAFAKKREE